MLKLVTSLFGSSPAPLAGRVCRWCRAQIGVDMLGHPVPLCSGCWGECMKPVGGRAEKWVRLNEAFPVEFAQWVEKLRGTDAADVHAEAMKIARQAIDEALVLQARAGELMKGGRVDEAQKVERQAQELRAEGYRIIAGSAQLEAA